MKNINISINNAKLIKFGVEFEKDEPIFVATIGLFSGLPAHIEV